MEDTMPIHMSGEELLPSLLLKTHLSTSSSFESLQDPATAHKDALDAAKEEHRRVRESALRAYRNHELKEDQQKLRILQTQEEERLRLEAERAKLAAEVLELQRKSIPVPAPREPTPPPVIRPQVTQKATNPPQSPPKPVTTLSQPNGGFQALSSPKPSAPTPPPPTASNGFRSPASQADPSRPSAPPERPPAVNHTKTTPAISSSRRHHIFPEAEKYLEIHKRLKQLRKFIADHAKNDPALKKKMGEMRREIRKSVGQLTEGRGANKTPVGVSISQNSTDTN
jgi:nucleoporin GLE1